MSSRRTVLSSRRLPLVTAVLLGTTLQPSVFLPRAALRLGRGAAFVASVGRKVTSADHRVSGRGGCTSAFSGVLGDKRCRSISMAAPDAVGLGDIASGAGGAESPEEAVEPWSERIQRSSDASRAIKGGNFVQIATVDAEGMPRCRTVVFRGFITATSRAGEKAMKMITDARSEKVAQVQRSSVCEMVWWIPPNSEQYRISGELQLVGEEDEGELQDARQEQWTKLSDPAREQFWWDQPGVSYTGEQTPPKGGRDSNGAILPPPATFLLVLLWPKQVKYLRLTDNYAQRDTLDTATGQWIAERVNP